MTRITLAEAQRILATEPLGTERYALANTVISLTAACEALQQAFDEQEKQLEYNREALR